MPYHLAIHNTENDTCQSYARRKNEERYMSENNNVISNDNSDLDAVIREVKKEFKMMLGKRKELIIKLG